MIGRSVCRRLSWGCYIGRDTQDVLEISWSLICFDLNFFELIQMNDLCWGEV